MYGAPTFAELARFLLEASAVMGELTDESVASGLQPRERLAELIEVAVFGALLFDVGLEHRASLCLGDGSVLPIACTDRRLDCVGQMQQPIEARHTFLRLQGVSFVAQRESPPSRP